MEKRIVEAFIHITRAEDECVHLSAEVTKENGRLNWLGISYDKRFELSALEYRNAEDAIFDAATHHWESFTKI